MRRLPRHALYALLPLTLVLGGLSAPPAAAVELDNERIDRAIARGQAWIEANPANFAETGLLEVVEELIAFYLLNNHSDDAGDQAAYREQVRMRQRAIVPYNGDNAKTLSYRYDPFAALNYLIAAQIVQSFGLDISSYRAIIDDMARHQAQLVPPSVSMQLWSSLYLERLGYSADLSVADLTRQTALATEPQTRALSRMLTDVEATGAGELLPALYIMTHEVFALTDFGALPPPALIAASRTDYQRLFEQAVTWATDAASIDILAELLVCVQLLGLDEVPALPRAIELILSYQLADGSFGAVKPDRPNPYRHGVLTAVSALALSRGQGGTEGRAAHP
jgi:hypothetical protein